MPHAYIALLLFALLMFILLLIMLVVRARAIKGGLRPSDMSPLNENISPFAYRLSRAHANCYENITIFAAIVFVASMTDSLAIMQNTALVFIAARIAQTVVHLYSIRARCSLMRGSLFGVQAILQIYWIVRLFLINL